MPVNWNAGGFDPTRSMAQGNAYANSLFDHAAKLDAGRKYAAGDYSGASSALAGRGDIAGAMAIDAGQSGIADKTHARALKQHEILKEAAPIFSAIYAKHGPEAAKQAFQQYAPTLKGLVDDETLGQITQAMQTNPEQTVQLLGAASKLTATKMGADLIFTNEQGVEVNRIVGTDDGKPPEVRNIISGNQEYTGQYNSKTKGWDQIGSPGPRFAKQIAGTQGDGGATYRLMTPDEKKAAGLPPEGAYQVSGKGQITRVAGNTSVRPIPSSALAGIQSNRRTLTKIDKAIAALSPKTTDNPDGYPNAIGLKTYLGDAITQRNDPGGVSARALVADVGSQKLHDRSGAAVTLSEAPRLQPFIPSVHDTAEAAITKLKNLRAEYEASTDEAEAFYSPEAGYMSLPDRGANPGPGNSGGKEVSGQFNEGQVYEDANGNRAKYQDGAFVEVQ